MTCPEPHSGSVIAALAPDFRSCPWLFQPTALPPHTSLRVREGGSLQGGTAPAIQTVLQWNMWGGEVSPGSPPHARASAVSPGSSPSAQVLLPAPIPGPPSSPVGLGVCLMILPLCLLVSHGCTGRAVALGIYLVPFRKSMSSTFASKNSSKLASPTQKTF